MIDKREILEVASTKSLLPNVVEKDYILGWILGGIDAQQTLKQSWVFKGGTCLKKCYFETYRFSEDLDFTLRDAGQLDENVLSTHLRAVVKWVAEQSGLNLPPEQISEQAFASFLATDGIPDPDLLIRTSGEERISNILLWQTAYSELYFTDVLWPDFGEQDFGGAVREFSRRERRFGARPG